MGIRAMKSVRSDSIATARIPATIAANSDSPSAGLNALVSPAAATISGDGVSPAASAAASGSPPGSAAATASADPGRSVGIAFEAPEDHALDRRIEIAHDRRGRRSCVPLSLQLRRDRSASWLRTARRPVKISKSTRPSA